MFKLLNQENIRYLILDIPRQMAAPLAPGAICALDTKIRSEARWLNDPAFGWNYAMLFASAKLPLPFQARDFHWIRLAYNLERYGLSFLHREENAPLLEAIGWESAADKRPRALVKGLLLAKDVTVKKISELTGLREKSIQAYEQLFFNVLDRRDKEPAYISGLVYPDGIVCEMKPDYLTTEPLEFLAMRVGYKNGVQDVLHLLGWRGMLARKPEDMENFEREIAATSAFSARNGGLWSNHKTIQQGRGIIAAAKHGGKDSGSKVVDRDGPTSLGPQLLFNFMEMCKSKQNSAPIKKAIPLTSPVQTPPRPPNPVYLCAPEPLNGGVTSPTPHPPSNLAAR